MRDIYPHRVPDVRGAFRDPVKRRLDELYEDASRDYAKIDGEMAGRGMLNSGARFRRQLDSIGKHLQLAIDWALTEGAMLPGQPFVSRVMVAPHIHSYLSAYLTRLIGLVADTRGLQSLSKVIEEDRARLEARLQGEVNDFEAGIWRSRSSEKSVTPSITTNNNSTTNNLTLNAPNHGVVQQAGVGVEQTANFAAAQQATADLLKLLEHIAMAEESKQEIRAEVETIRLQLQRSAPNRSVIKAAAEGLQQLAYGVAGNLLTPQVSALLTALGLQ